MSKIIKSTAKWITKKIVKIVVVVIALFLCLMLGITFSLKAIKDKNNLIETINENNIKLMSFLGYGI